MKKIAFLTVMALVGMNSLVWAETVKIPLPEFDDCYSSGQSLESTISLDLQTTFQSIEQVRIEVAGKIIPSFGKADQPIGVNTIATMADPDKFVFSLAPDSAATDAWSTSFAGERFYTENTLTPSGNPNWDFLLDGTGELTCKFEPDDANYIPSTGIVFKTYLIVEGTVLTHTPIDDPYPVYGDANHDGRVDVGDLGIVAANYGRQDKVWTDTDLDFNGDGSYDVGDLGIWAANYGSMSFWGVVTFEEGDFNYDGKVDVGDLGILAANYGYGTSGASVPEPLSLLLLSLGGVFLARRK